MNGTWIRNTVLLLLTVLLATSCSNGPTSTYQELGPAANTRGFGRQFPSDPYEQAFTFGVGDTLQLKVPGAEEFEVIETVRQDGKISVPLIGDVAVAGLTTDQVSKKIATLASGFVEGPKVTVSVVEVTSKHYFVVGRNHSTGGIDAIKVPYVGDTTLLDAFVEMGAPSTLLDDDGAVKVIFPDPHHPIVHTINVREILLEGRSGGNVQIYPDTVVYVPPTVWGHINSFVAGVSYPLENLFRISRSVTELDATLRVIEGEDIYRRTR